MKKKYDKPEMAIFEWGLTYTLLQSSYPDDSDPNDRTYDFDDEDEYYDGELG